MAGGIVTSGLQRDHVVNGLERQVVPLAVVRWRFVDRDQLITSCRTPGRLHEVLDRRTLTATINLLDGGETQDREIVRSTGDGGRDERIRG